MVEEECRQLRQAQTIGRVGSWSHDLASDAVVLSDGVLDLFGLDRDSPLGAGEMLDLCVHGEDRRAVSRAYQVMVETGDPMSIRYRVISARDGVERWVQSRATVIRDRPGGPGRVVGTLADVDELVGAEMAAQQAHAALVRAYSFQQAVITASPMPSTSWTSPVVDFTGPTCWRRTSSVTPRRSWR